MFFNQSFYRSGFPQLGKRWSLSPIFTKYSDFRYRPRAFTGARRQNRAISLVTTTSAKIYRTISQSPLCSDVTWQKHAIAFAGLPNGSGWRYFWAKTWFSSLNVFNIIKCNIVFIFSLCVKKTYCALTSFLQNSKRIRIRRDFNFFVSGKCFFDVKCRFVLDLF